MNTNRPCWLTRACALQIPGSPRKQVVEDLSKKLRDLGRYRGHEVDAIFRDDIEIDLQMNKMGYLLTDGKSGLAGSARAFQDMARLYKGDKRAYEKILTEARELISIAEKINSIDDAQIAADIKLWPQTTGYWTLGEIAILVKQCAENTFFTTADKATGDTIFADMLTKAAQKARSDTFPRYRNSSDVEHHRRAIENVLFGDEKSAVKFDDILLVCRLYKSWPETFEKLARAMKLRLSALLPLAFLTALERRQLFGKWCRQNYSAEEAQDFTEYLEEISQKCAKRKEVQSSVYEVFTVTQLSRVRKAAGGFFWWTNIFSSGQKTQFRRALAVYQKFLETATLPSIGPITEKAIGIRNEIEAKRQETLAEETQTNKTAAEGEEPRQERRTQKVPFDQYESALMVDACANVLDGKTSRQQAANDLSKILRKLGIVRGLKIDDGYRDTKGIYSQLGRMIYLMSDGKNGSKYVSQGFKNIINLYKTNHQAYEEILSNAKNMISPKTLSDQAPHESGKQLHVTDVNSRTRTDSNDALEPTDIQTGTRQIITPEQRKTLFREWCQTNVTESPEKQLKNLEILAPWCIERKFVLKSIYEVCTKKLLEQIRKEILEDKYFRFLFTTDKIESIKKTIDAYQVFLFSFTISAQSRDEQAIQK